MSADDEARRDVAHLGHIELLSPKPAESVQFFCDVLGMQEVACQGQSVYLRAWGEYERYSLKLTEARQAGIAHNIAYWVDNREDVLRAADIYLEHGIPIEFAPGKHAIAQGFFLYVREPGGTRVEIATGSYLIFDPDWKPIIWSQADRVKGQAWGQPTVATFHTYGTPPVELTAGDEAKPRK